MDSKAAVTILIPTYNEADNLEKLLPLLTWAEEIIVIDSYSTDNTLALAKQFGAKTIQRPYLNPADQKNYGINQASCPWILLLDADEFPDEEIINNIKRVANTPIQNNTPTAFAFLRRQYFLGKEIKYSGWQNDWIIRLIQNNGLRYTQGEVHETFDLDRQNISRIKGILHHYTSPNLEFFIQKQIRYAKMSATEYMPKTKRITLYHLWFKPSFRFFKHFIIKQGFRDGYRGLVISYILALFVRLRYIYMLEMKLKTLKDKTTNQQSNHNTKIQ
jgi:glycosyltransferase involved in cell wall biosynthesis